MIIPPEINRKYKEIHNYVEFHASKIKEKIYRYCEKKEYAFLSRVKQPESLSEKIESGRFKKWSEIDDLFACNIIIPTLKHEETVLEYLSKEYPQCKLILRDTMKKAPDVFRFDSTRYLSKINLPHESELLFEVQIRTVFEHAWITTTHDLVYKYHNIDWKRLRLAAELKANIEMLDNIILAFEENTSFRKENTWPEINSKIEIQKFINNCFANNLLPSEYLPNDVTRFVNTLFKLISLNPLFNQFDQEKYVSASIEFLRECFLSYKKDSFPMSISLTQLIFGHLFDAGMIKDERTFTPIITSELELFFPTTKKIKDRFDFEIVK